MPRVQLVTIYNEANETTDIIGIFDHGVSRETILALLAGAGLDVAYFERDMHIQLIWKNTISAEHTHYPSKHVPAYGDVPARWTEPSNSSRLIPL